MRTAEKSSDLFFGTQAHQLVLHKSSQTSNTMVAKCYTSLYGSEAYYHVTTGLEIIFLK